MSHSHSASDRIFIALTTLIVLAPLPLAANRAWSWSLLSLASALLTLIWVVCRLRGRCRPGLPAARLALPATLFLTALAWAVLQTLPIMPLSWAHPVWTEASAALSRPLGATISANPEMSGHAVMRLAAYGLIFVLATQLGRQRHRAVWGLKSVAAAVLVYAAYALFCHLIELEYILWMPKWAYQGDATGTFVGRAAFGAFAGIGVLACLAQAIRRSTAQRPSIGTGERIERLLARTVPWLIASGFLWLAVLASHSRGAFLVTGAGCLALLTAATIGRLVRLRQTLALLLVLTGLAGGAVLADGGTTLARMSGEGDLTGDRPNLMRLTWAAIDDAPLTGHGLGTFASAIMPYRDTSLPRPVLYNHAHNSWEEVIMDLGWPAGLCLIFAVMIPVAVCCAGLVRRRQDQIFPALAVAVATLLGLQAIIDFTVQIPALAALFAYLLGIGYSQSWSVNTTKDSEQDLGP
jgi:O-antigen ligase